LSRKKFKSILSGKDAVVFLTVVLRLISGDSSSDQFEKESFVTEFPGRA